MSSLNYLCAVLITLIWLRCIECLSLNPKVIANSYLDIGCLYLVGACFLVLLWFLGRVKRKSMYPSHPPAYNIELIWI